MTVEELEGLTNKELLKLKTKAWYDKNKYDLGLIELEIISRFEWMVDDGTIPEEWTMKDNLPKF